MLAKVWCLITGGTLMAIGVPFVMGNPFSAWHAVVVLGFITMAVGVLQTVYDHGKPLGWWD